MRTLVELLSHCWTSELERVATCALSRKEQKFKHWLMESVVLALKILSGLFPLGCMLTPFSARFTATTNIFDTRNETGKKVNSLKSTCTLPRSKGVLNLPYKLGYKKILYLFTKLLCTSHHLYKLK